MVYMNHTMQEYMPYLVLEIKVSARCQRRRTCKKLQFFFFTLNLVVKGRVKILWTKVSNNSYVPVFFFFIRHC